jgi:hypothetical protein
MKVFKTEITNRDSCKTYALKRIGMIDLVNIIDNTPSLIDLCSNVRFEKIDEPEVGALLIWSESNDYSQNLFYAHCILEDSTIVSIKSRDIGHCAIYEQNDMISDCTNEGYKATLRLRHFKDVKKPDIILKAKAQKEIKKEK